MRSALVGILAIALCSAAAWGYTIDTFSVGYQDLADPSGTTAETVGPFVGDIRGDYRHAEVERTAGGPGDAALMIWTTPDRCDFISDPQVSGKFTLEYGLWADAAASPLGDLTEDGTSVLALWILSSDEQVDVGLTIRDAAGEEATVAKLTPEVEFGVDAPEELQFPLWEFLAANAALDLTDVESLRLEAQGGPDDDLVIDWIGSSQIPEPATMAMLGLAVAGLGGYIRRRRRA